MLAAAAPRGRGRSHGQAAAPFGQRVPAHRQQRARRRQHTAASRPCGCSRSSGPDHFSTGPLSCVVCPANTFFSAAETTSCSDCPNGRFAPLVETCVADNAAACAAWASDGTAAPCEAAGACTYTAASVGVGEACVASDAAQCAGWTSDDTAAPCLAAGACTYSRTSGATRIDDCKCPSDTYAPSGATECSACPSGRFAEAASTSIGDCECPGDTLKVNERAVEEDCVATDASACATWVSDGTDTPCTTAGACTYTDAVATAVAEACIASDLARCAGWTNDGTAAPCLAAGACAYTQSKTSAGVVSEACVAIDANTCPSWTSDGTAGPCTGAGACAYTAAVEEVEEDCVATDAAQCAGWTSDGTAAPCLAAGTCTYTPAAELTYDCVACAAGTQHFLFSWGVKYKSWKGIPIPGMDEIRTMDEALAHPHYAEPADHAWTITNFFESPSDGCSSCITQLEAWFAPHVSGPYTFKIASDAYSYLWFGENELEDHALADSIIASVGPPCGPVEGCLEGGIGGGCVTPECYNTSPRQWDEFPSQTADAIELVAHRQYWLRAAGYAVEERPGHLAVGVEGPDGLSLLPIPVDDFLSAANNGGYADETCIDCAAGLYDHDGYAGTACASCPLDTYQDFTRSSHCVSCPGGMITHETESASPSDCTTHPHYVGCFEDRESLLYGRDLVGARFRMHFSRQTEATRQVHCLSATRERRPTLSTWTSCTTRPMRLTLPPARFS
eukprot:COSAG04_NODE_81_length_27945_cov_46.142821_26_plen_733_part_00